MTFLYLNSDKMGHGEPQLGRKLMASFLKELAESSVQVDMIGCVNDGIFLTTEGSPVIDSLKRMKEDGAQIATCGTCLDYHQRQDKLLIGDVGTMDQTVDIMGMADKVIQP
ncbi:MAG: sulfurtransferase-like selenium metabolism protein YedF [Caldithrix sp.]|nr:sulfurtransferase-like selenium metabolism protein YedF [Caldithrix sp.]